MSADLTPFIIYININGVGI